MTTLTHWRKTDNGDTLTYEHIGGNMTITQQKGVRHGGTETDDRRRDRKPEIPKAAWDELVEDIKRYDPI